MKFKNKEERDKFVESNMGLVVSIVKKYSFYLDEFEDLVQIGTIGLLKAVDAFDESKGNKFSTFAIYHIRGILLKTYRDEKNGIRYSRELLRVKKKINSYMNENPFATIEEISRNLNIDIDIVKKANAINFNIESLNRELYRDQDDESVIVADYIAAKETFEKQNSEFDLLINNLNEKEKFILNSIFLEGKSQREIGNKIGVSQAQVSRIKNRIINKLRYELKEVI